MQCTKNKNIGEIINQSFEATEECLGIETHVDVNESSTNSCTLEQVSNRAKWGNGLEFLMSCIAMSVGLGNIWRFPFTAYENGGGAFLIPYIIVLFIIGRPMYYMEMVLGQFSSKSSVMVFGHIKPAMKGIGYVQVFAAGCVAIYYCSLVALILFYLVSSFTSVLPWTKCKEEWEITSFLQNVTCLASNSPVSYRLNTMSSSELWFTHEVLKEKTSIDHGIGLPEWRLSLCLLFGWICSFVISVKSIRSSGKFSYFLALFPYVIMVILLVRAVTLEGAVKGILYFVTPDWEKILSAKVWYHAVSQCFFSLNVGGGAVIMYSSYNDFTHNINRDAMVVTTLDTFTSLLAGITAFGILGNLAHGLNVDVKDAITSGGTGLVFISYPEAIAKFESVPWVFAILFFFMLFVLGVGSLVALHSCVNTAILDNFPKLKSWQVSAGTSTIGFFVGLIFVTPGGQVVLTIVDYFIGTFTVFMIGVLEMVTVIWCYGIENFCNDVEYMLKRKVSIFWRICWGIITPMFLIVIFIYFLATLPRLSYGHHRIPDTALVCGWLLVGIIISILVFCLLKTIYKRKKVGFPEMLFTAFSSENWGPAKQEEKEAWQEFKRKKMEIVVKSGELLLWQKIKFFIGKETK